MKLKNSLIGLGIAFMCLGNFILAVNINQNAQISDDEIRKRAEKLGMVENDAILTSDLENAQIEKEDPEEEVKKPELADNSMGDGTEDLEGDGKKQDVVTENHQEIEEPEKTVQDDTEKSSGEKKNKKKKNKKTEKATGNTENGNTISVKIPSGMTAGEICRSLEKKGLVKDAEDFREYLVEKNIQRSLQAGTFEIPEGADYDEIISVIYRG